MPPSTLFPLLSLALFSLPTLAKIQSSCQPSRPDFCVGTNYNGSQTDLYICGDSRLGPAKLPTKLPLDAVTDIYDPFGGLCPGAFLTAWFNKTSGYYNYPPLGGFATDVVGAPIVAEFTLQPGMAVDRFGSERGLYLAPAAAPYMQRALPPSNLDMPVGNPEFPYNYRVYVVRKELNVSAGPIAPWFGQPGQGVQYRTTVPVEMLVAQGVLGPVDPGWLLGM